MRTLSKFIAMLSAVILVQANDQPSPTEANITTPLVAVPAFQNRTGANTHGESRLPDNAGDIAADVVSQTLTSSGHFRVLNRASFTLQQIDEERAFSATAASSSGDFMKLCRELNAQFLVTGAISNFRVDKREAVAYGVKRRLFATRITLDLRVTDVATGELAYQASPQKTVTTQVPAGVTEMTDINDWEAILRAVIAEASDEMVSQIARRTGAIVANAEEIELDVSSKPEGADIMIDGDFVGNTPSKILTTKGRHKMQIELQGYQTWERNINASQGMKVAPVLEKIPVAPAATKDDIETKTDD